MLFFLLLLLLDCYLLHLPTLLLFSFSLNGLVYGFEFWQLFVAAGKLLVVDVASTNRLIFLGLEIYIRPVYFGVRYRLDEIILFRNLSDLCCTVYFPHDALDSCHT